MKKIYDKKILINFIISRLIIIMLFIIGTILTKSKFTEIFNYYDNEWYLNIAMNGYYEQGVCFFPLIPLIIRLFYYIKIPVLGMVIVNNVVCYLTAILLKKMTNNNLISYFWLYSPISVFTFMLYTESIFIFLTLYAFYLYKEKKYLLAGIMLGLSVMCRSLGSMLFFAIFIFMFIDFIKKKVKFKDILKMYIPATIISVLYPIYLQIKFGNWKAFMDNQFIYWNRESGNIITIMIKDIKFFFETNVPLFKINIIVTMLILGLLIFLIYKDIKNNKKLTINSLYLIFSILVIYSSCRASYNIPSTSYYRYFLGCSSFYLMLDNKNINSDGRKVIFLQLLTLSLIVTFLFAVNAFFC